jgi:hypothetical protein
VRTRVSSPLPLSSGPGGAIAGLMADLGPPEPGSPSDRGPAGHREALCSRPLSQEGIGKDIARGRAGRGGICQPRSPGWGRHRPRCTCDGAGAGPAPPPGRSPHPARAALGSPGCILPGRPHLELGGEAGPERRPGRGEPRGAGRGDGAGPGRPVRAAAAAGAGERWRGGREGAGPRGSQDCADCGRSGSGSGSGVDACHLAWPCVSVLHSDPGGSVDPTRICGCGEPPGRGTPFLGVGLCSPAVRTGNMEVMGTQPRPLPSSLKFFKVPCGLSPRVGSHRSQPDTDLCS